MSCLTSPRVSAIVLGMAAALLTGCLNLQTNIALYGQEQWHGVMAMQFAPELVEMMEQEGSQSSTSTADLEKLIAQAQSTANRADLNVSFNEVKGDDGSLNYLLQAEGQNLQTLNEVFFEGKADITVAEVNGQRQIAIRADMSDDSSEAPATPQDIEMMKTFGLGVTFRISGGEIISSNASRVEGNTAIWDFPTTIEVTLTEAPAFSPEEIALVAPPADSGASLAILQSMLADLEQGQVSSDMALELPEITNPAVETMETTNDSPTGPSPALVEPAAEPPAEELGEGPTPDVATDLTMNIYPEQSNETPMVEGQALPNSGSIMPERFSIATLILATLTLLVLGSGAITNIRLDPTERI